ncbi:MAG: hypothetical protein IPI67_35395 [Myxococcales bacterium]|nr:hypothetical protein [Myxococcales bacterium]
MLFRNVMGAALALGVVFSAAEAGASLPAGVWVKVQKVVFEPNATAPTKIQIHGVAMLYDKSTGTSYAGYTEPAFGYLYYDCPSGQEKTCVSEWADVEKNILATSDVCIGLGDQSLPTGTLRSSTALPANADKYPIAVGVLSGYTPCKVIETFLLSQPDGGTGGSGGTGGGGTGGAGTGGASTGGSAGAGTGGSAGAGTGGAAGAGTGGSAGAGTGGSAGTAGSAGAVGSGGASSGGASAGGASSGGASTGGTASGTGGKAGGGSSEDDGGCTIAGVNASSSSLFWAAAALSTAFALRRRRRA